MIFLGTEIENEATFLTLGNLSESDSKIFCKGYLDETTAPPRTTASPGTEIDFEKIYSVCRGSIKNTSLLLSAVLSQPDFDTGVDVLLDTPEFSYYGNLMHDAVNESSADAINKMKLFNLVLDSKNYELPLEKIPENLKSVAEDLHKHNKLEMYRSCPLNTHRLVEYPTMTFSTPLVASYFKLRGEQVLEKFWKKGHKFLEKKFRLAGKFLES